MAFNAFTGVTLSTDHKTLLIDGITNPPFVPTRIDAAIVDPADEDRRLQGFESEPKVGDDWHVEVKQADLPDGKADFTGTDEVLVVGVATSIDGECFVWGGISDPPSLALTLKIGIELKPVGVDPDA